MSAFASLRTRNVVELTASVSGYPIVVESDPSLEVWSSVRYPRKSDRSCLVTYHPDRAKYLDYLIAHECGHIYRFFSANPEDRLLSATSSSQVERAKQQVAKEPWKGRGRIPESLRDEFLGSLCSGLVGQVANTPADCRIEAWMYENFEELRDVQASALSESYSTFVKCLEPEIKRYAPPSIYRGSNAMNYVLAKAIQNVLHESELLTPYFKDGLVAVGEKLASHLTAEGQGYLSDRRIADAWAKDLHIADWYSWISLL